MENEPVLMGCMSDERSSFGMHLQMDSQMCQCTDYKFESNSYRLSGLQSEF